MLEQRRCHRARRAATPAPRRRCKRRPGVRRVRLKRRASGLRGHGPWVQGTGVRGQAPAPAPAPAQWRGSGLRARARVRVRVRRTSRAAGWPTSRAATAAARQRAAARRRVATAARPWATSSRRPQPSFARRLPSSRPPPTGVSCGRPARSARRSSAAGSGGAACPGQGSHTSEQQACLARASLGFEPREAYGLSGSPAGASLEEPTTRKLRA